MCYVFKGDYFFNISRCVMFLKGIIFLIHSESFFKKLFFPSFFKTFIIVCIYYYSTIIFIS